MFTARYGLSVYIKDIRFVFKRVKWLLKLSTCKLGIKSLGIAAVYSVSKFTEMHSAVFKPLTCAKNEEMDGRSDFNKFLEALQKSLKYFLIRRLNQLLLLSLQNKFYPNLLTLNPNYYYHCKTQWCSITFILLDLGLSFW